MYYIVQKNVFREENYDNLILALDRLKLSYEIVDVLPFIETFEFHCKDKNVFPFGSTKMARLSKLYGWTPGSQLNDNHDYQVYKNFYGDNLLNYDSLIYKFDDEFFVDKPFFARPTKDSKAFTGKVFDMETWRKFRNTALINILDKDTEIQVSLVKVIQKEIRFWIVKGKIATASQYKLGTRVVLSDTVDQPAYDFCNKMIQLFQLNDAFVMDLCLVNDEYKIVECGCINCAGFYRADLQKLLVKLEEAFSNDYFDRCYPSFCNPMDQNFLRL